MNHLPAKAARKRGRNHSSQAGGDRAQRARLFLSSDPCHLLGRAAHGLARPDFALAHHALFELSTVHTIGGPELVSFSEGLLRKFSSPEGYFALNIVTYGDPQGLRTSADRMLSATFSVVEKIRIVISYSFSQHARASVVCACNPVLFRRWGWMDGGIWLGS